MKPGHRTVFILAAAIALIAAGSSFRAGEQFARAGQSVDEARAATFKALAAG